MEVFTINKKVIFTRKMFSYFEGDISRRKLCAKCLLKALREGAGRLNLNRTSSN